MAIQSFSDRATEQFFLTGIPARKVGWAMISHLVRRKLDLVHYAGKLGDLRSPPGNHLESLKGTLIGHHSIRTNDQWRVVFRWTDAGPADVRVTDYH